PTHRGRQGRTMAVWRQPGDVLRAEKSRLRLCSGGWLQPSGIDVGGLRVSVVAMRVVVATGVVVAASIVVAAVVRRVRIRIDGASGRRRGEQAGDDRSFDAHCSLHGNLSRPTPMVP